MATVLDRMRRFFGQLEPSGSVAKAEPRAEMREIGVTGLVHSGGRISEGFLDKLRGSQALKAYREMSENDAMVGAMLTMIETAVRGVRHDAEAGEDGPGAEEAAEYLGTVLDDMSHSWGSLVSEWMAAPIYGFAPFEIVLKLRQGQQATPGESSRYSDGKIGVRKLAIRHPDTVERWIFDEAGGVQGLVQRAQSQGFRPVEIPIEKLVVFRMRSRKGNPEGTSLLRSSFVSYFRKKRIEEIEAIGVERDLNGIPLIYTPPQWHSAEASAANVTSLNDMKKIARNVRNDQQAGLVMPSVFDENGNRLLEFLLVTTGGRRNFDTSAIIERLSRHMAMTLLQDHILIGHEQTGSFALASSKTDLAALVLGAFLDDIDDTLNRHLVPRLMLLNSMPTDERMPRFVHGDIETRDLESLGTFLQALANAGMPLFPTEDGELESELLHMAGLPADSLAVPPPPPPAPVIIQPPPAQPAEEEKRPPPPPPPPTEKREPAPPVVVNVRPPPALSREDVREVVRDVVTGGQPSSVVVVPATTTEKVRPVKKRTKWVRGKGGEVIGAETTDVTRVELVRDKDGKVIGTDITENAEGEE